MGGHDHPAERLPTLFRGLTLFNLVVLLAAVACGAQVRTDGTEPASTIGSPSSEVRSVQATPSSQPPLPKSWPPRLEGKSLTFPSIRRALAFLRRNMPTAIELPSGLPNDVRVAPRPLYIQTIDGVRSAQLHLLFGSTGHLYVEWGVSQLDGCAPEDSISVTVNGQQGRLREAPGDRWTELIWPATLERPFGALGLAGSFPRAQLLAMARSMKPPPPAAATDVGC
jgi:hypothetical protein